MEMPGIRHKMTPDFFYSYNDDQRACLLLDDKGFIKYCTPATAEYFGINPDVIINQNATILFPGFQLEALFSGIKNISSPDCQNNNNGDNRVESNCKDVVVSIPLQLDGRQFFLLEIRTQYRFSSQDEKLKKFEEVAELNGDAIAVTSLDGLIEFVNTAFEELTGYRREEIIGKTHALLATGTHEPDFSQNMWRVLRAGKSFRGQFINRRQDGTIYYEDKIIRPFYNSQGEITNYIASGRDVSERVQILHRLEHLATHDSLTGLPNRNLFLDRLAQAEARGSRNRDGFAVVLLDLDHFKAINDNFGHAVGDVVLQTTAVRIKQCLREEDTVARLGGDEFSLILDEIATLRGGTKVVKKMAEKIVALLREPLTIDGQNISLQASIGIAIYPEHGEDGHSLLKYADCAMYKVKTRGGDNYLIFDGKVETSFTYELHKTRN